MFTLFIAIYFLLIYNSCDKKELGGFLMEKNFRLHKKRTGQWVCLSGAVLALATVGVERVSAEDNSWVARTVEMVKKDLQESKDSTKYLIKWGDTLSVIAQAVNVKMEVLAQINKIANVDLIYAGNTLFISKDGHRIVVNDQDKAAAYRVVSSDDSSIDEPVIVEKVTEFDSKNVDSIKEFIDKDKIINDNLKGTEKTNIPDKKQVTNLSDITTNDNTSILLPSSHEEVISEVSRKEEVMIPSSEAGNSSSVTPIKTVVSAPSTNVVSKETTGETVANEVVTGLTENGDSNASTTTDSFTNIVKESSISSTTNNGIKSIEPTSQTITITERVVRLTEGLPYQVVYQEDNTLTVGQTSVVSEGSLGEKVSIQNVVLKDGVEVSRETTSMTVNKEPVNRIVKVGTKDTASQVNSNNSSELNNAGVSIPSVLPKKETIYTEIVESTNKKVISDDTELNEKVKDVKNSISIPTISNDNLATTKLVEIYDNTLFEDRRELENIQASFVTVTVKRRREFVKEDDQVETVISKDIPVITGVVRVGTRKPGYETVKADGGLVNLSSDLAKEKLSKMKVFDNKDSLLSNNIPGYLGNAISIEYNDNFKKTQLGLQISPENLRVNSLPTIYKFDAKSQLLSPLPTAINGNMAFAPIIESGDYILADRTLQDKVNQFSPEYNKNQLINGNHGDSIKGRSVAFVLDSSGSMEETDPENKRVTLSEELINKLDASKDKVSVIDFDSRAKILSSLSSDFNKSKKSLTEIDQYGGTDLISGLEAGIEELKSDISGNKKLLFFLTDGKDESGNNDYANIIQKAKDNDITIFTIGLKSVDENILRYIANQTGGKYYYAEEDSSLPEIFKQLDEDAIQKATDTNGDKISGRYTKDILKGLLLSGTGQQLFKEQVEEVRKELAREHSIPVSSYTNLSEEEKQKLFNGFIDAIDENKIEERFEGILKKDLDGDTLLNGEEIHVERKSNDKAYLYLVSDPNNQDTDGDGIKDAKDGTPRDMITTPLPTESNEVDTDGDGWDDAHESRMHTDVKRWDIGDRDLLLFSLLAYFNFKDDYKGLTLSAISNKEGDLLSKVADAAPLVNYLELLDNNSKDKSFFDKWTFLGRDTVEYDKGTEDKVHSDVLWFGNENKIVIAYRGTDEIGGRSFLNNELVIDLKIALNNTKIREKAAEQIRRIIQNNKDKEIYITGHSLGGYEAYIGFLESHVLPNGTIAKKVVNFNGPGINVFDKFNLDTLGSLYARNKESVKAYSTNKLSVNTLIVNGGLGENANKVITEESLDIIKDVMRGKNIAFSLLKNGAQGVARIGILHHPNLQKIRTAYLSPDKLKEEDVKKIETQKNDVFSYPHLLTSFFYDLDQGLRSSKDKFQAPFTEETNLLKVFAKTLLRTSSEWLKTQTSNIFTSIKNVINTK